MQHIHEKGTTVKPRERNANLASTPKAGLVATLCGLLHVKGIDAPKIGQGGGAPLRRRAFAGLSVLATTLATLGLATAAAVAEEVHIYSSSFGSEGSGPGQFMQPAGVAVNDSTSLTEPGGGDVYVVDKGNNRVERFSSVGAYIGQFNGSGTVEVEPGKVEVGKAAPTGAFSNPEWIAVDNDVLSPSHGDVYVTDNAHKVIDKFSETGTYLGQLTGSCEKNEESPPCSGSRFIPFEELDGIAVDLAGELLGLPVDRGDRQLQRRSGKRVPCEPRETINRREYDPGLCGGARRRPVYQRQN